VSHLSQIYLFFASFECVFVVFLRYKVFKTYK